MEFQLETTRREIRLFERSKQVSGPRVAVHRLRIFRDSARQCSLVRGVYAAELMPMILADLDAIDRDKSGITADTALKFERVLGIPMDFWTSLESNYRLWLARQRLG
jgi:hypothetical protein